MWSHVPIVTMAILRFRIRTLMLAASLAAALCAGKVSSDRRRARFDAQFRWHLEQAAKFNDLLRGEDSKRLDGADRRRVHRAWQWHDDLALKYLHARNTPWLPVPPDPPPPG